MHPTTGLALALFAALAAGPPGPDPDERLLLEVGQQPDARGVTAYLRKRIPDAGEEARLSRLVRDLGDDRFGVREKASEALIEAGPTALSHLRAALGAADLEVRRRAQRAIDRIGRDPHQERLAAALRLVARHRPAGADALVLEYVGAVEREGPGEETLAALSAVGLDGGGSPTAAVREALRSASLSRRIVATHAVAQAPPRQRGPLVPLLRDAAPRVRYEAARGLFTGGESQAGPVLAALVGEPSDLGYQAEELLLRAAGEGAPPIAWTRDEAGRTAAARAWRSWWDEKGVKIDLARVSFADTLLGLTVTCEFSTAGAGAGSVRTLGPDRKERWVINGIDSPTDVQLLPGGRVLVAEHHPNRVTERDRSGKTLWEKKLTEKPVSCQRLPGGNTFIATYSSLIEVTPEGREVLRIPNDGGMIYCGRRLRDGSIVSINSTGKVRVFDRAGKELRSFSPASDAAGCGWWASVDALPGGRYLLALGTSNKVVECDATGKILWEASVKSGLSWAQRLPNGNTLIAALSENSIVEIDRAGKELWRVKTPGRPFRAIRY